MSIYVVSFGVCWLGIEGFFVISAGGASGLSGPAGIAGQPSTYLSTCSAYIYLHLRLHWEQEHCWNMLQHCVVATPHSGNLGGKWAV